MSTRTEAARSDKRAAPKKRAAVDAVFAALADPARRAIVDLLRVEPRRAGELADALGMTPPAMSRHLRVLRKSGFIEVASVEHDARVRLFRLKHAPFAELRTWVERVEAHWTEQLASFAQHVERTRGRR